MSNNKNKIKKLLYNNVWLVDHIASSNNNNVWLVDHIASNNNDTNNDNNNNATPYLHSGLPLVQQLQQNIYQGVTIAFQNRARACVNESLQHRNNNNNNNNNNSNNSSNNSNNNNNISNNNSKLVGISHLRIS